MSLALRCSVVLLWRRIRRGPQDFADDSLLSLGPVYGPILCCIIAVQHWFLLFITLLRPIDEVELVEAEWDVAEFDWVSRVFVDGMVVVFRVLVCTDVQLCEREKRQARDLAR